MKNAKKQNGFTAIEIALIISIIAILGALAIPRFLKVKESSSQSAMNNDARQIASAAQQYMIENKTESTTIDYDPDTGEISGPLREYLEKIAPNYIISDKITIDGTFTIIHNSIGTSIYTSEGQFIRHQHN